MPGQVQQFKQQPDGIEFQHGRNVTLPGGIEGILIVDRFQSVPYNGSRRGTASDKAQVPGAGRGYHDRLIGGQKFLQYSFRTYTFIIQRYGCE